MNTLASANLVAWAVQAAVLVAVAAPLPRLLRVSSPRVRVAIWRVLLVACLLLPAIQPWAEEPAPVPVAATMEAAASATSVAGAAQAAELRAPRPAAVPVRLRWPSPVALAAVLAAGVALRLGWLGLGLFTLGRLRRSTRPLEPRPASIERAVEMAGTDAEFLVSATASRPVTCGIRRPVVIVPQNFEQFPEGEQAAIACHELLHVRRADWAWNVADEVTRAVFWFHPAIWWLINEIQLAREQLVDREVVRRLGTKQPYLQALLRIARPVPRLVLTPASLFLKRAHLKQRVALLVKEGSMSKARLACAVLIMVVVVFTTGRLAVSAVPLQRTAGPQLVVRAATSNLAASVLPAVAGTTMNGAGPIPAAGSPGQPAAAASAPQGGQGGVIGANTLNVVRRVDPMAAGLTGRAIVGVVVDAGGNVTLAGPQGPDGAPYDVTVAHAAVEAAKQWTFDAASAETRTTFLGFNLTPHNTTGLIDAPVVRIGGPIPPPQKIVDVKPVYPTEAQHRRIQGVQILEVSIAPSGDVLDARALRGNYALVRAAMDTVLQWKFSEWPGLERRVMVVTVNYTLDNSTQSVAAPASGLAAGQVRPIPGSPVQYGTATDWPPEAIRAGGTIEPPTKIVDVRPVYPAAVLKAGVQGDVICDLLVASDGKVKDVRVLQSSPSLDQAAVDAVRQWEFTPTLLNGNPIPVVVTVTVSFTVR